MERIIVKDGWITHHKRFIDENEGIECFRRLKNGLLWEQGKIVLYGKSYLIPRMESFHSINGEKYSYSGKKLAIHPFNDILFELKDRIERITPDSFNSVLINWYRNGDDSNGWHADNEKELGQNPLIASISLGVTRRFELLHIHTKERLNIDLGHGDLLIMGGSLQHYWKHRIPKQPKISEARINLTFRKIDSAH